MAAWSMFLLADFALAVQLLPEPLQQAALSARPAATAAEHGGLEGALPLDLTLRAVDVEPTSARLEWAVQGGAGLVTQAACQTGEGLFLPPFRSEGAGVHVASWQGLAPGLRYDCRLAAYDERGESRTVHVTFETAAALG